jgi:hypothetical protein
MNANDLIFNGDDKNINSGGFSVQSMLMKSTQSPFITINNNSPFSGGNNNNNNTKQVSDIFNSLVVPNWALYNPNNLQKIIINTNDKDKNVYANECDNTCDDDTIQDTLYDKLFNLANVKTDISKKDNKGNKCNKSNKRNKRNKDNKTKKIIASPNKSPKRKTKKRTKKGGDNDNNDASTDAK